MANKGRLKNPAELIFHGLQHHPLQGSACLGAAVIRLSHRNLLPMLAGWSDQSFFATGTNFPTGRISPS